MFDILPKITVVTVCFNAVDGLECTIQSVINQSYRNIEYVIIDGGSTDGTVDVVKKYQSCVDYFVSEPDNGIFDAMNKGIKVATGEWLIFMNAGDTFVNKDVVRSVFVDRNIEHLGVIFGKWFLKYKGRVRLVETRPFYQNNHKFKGMGFSHQSVFVKTIFARKYSFDLAYNLSADYNMIWKLYYDEHVGFLDVDIPICVMEEETGSTVHNYKRHIREVATICGYQNNIFSEVFFSYLIICFKIKRFLKTVLFK